jgi:tryptophan-rich sensory protein
MPLTDIESGELRTWRRDAGYGAIALGAVIAASVSGALATYPSLMPWYDSLAKPPFNPPNSVFPEVWTTLYGIMAFTVWRVLRHRPDSDDRHVALALFFTQLALNAAWSWMFFWMQNPLLGLINIVPQFLVVLATIRAFAKVDTIAALCLAPLAAWLAFATILNASIWWLN